MTQEKQALLTMLQEEETESRSKHTTRTKRKQKEKLISTSDGTIYRELLSGQRVKAQRERPSKKERLRYLRRIKKKLGIKGRIKES
jgi:hypothetical protein